MFTMVITYTAAAVVLLGLCIFIHELGHLLGGKMVGIKAEVFSMGYGKGIFKKKFGDTTYQITAIPFGGYCKFYGENPGEDREEKGYEFLTAHPMRRFVTVIMGPLFNLFFGIILFYMMNIIGYEKETNKINIPKVLVSSSYTCPAYKGGLRTGDRIVKIDDSEIIGFSDIQAKVMFSKGKTLKVKVIRDGKEFVKSITPERSKYSGRFTIGLEPFGKGVIVGGVVAGGAADKSNLKKMDIIKSIDGVKIKDPEHFRNIIRSSLNKNLIFKITRGDEEINRSVKPGAKKIVSINNEPLLDDKMISKGVEDKDIKIDDKLITSKKDFYLKVNSSNGKDITLEVKSQKYKGIAEVKEIGFVGLYPSIISEMVTVKSGFIDAVVPAFEQPYNFIVMNIKGMGMLFSGKIPVRENLGGPLKIMKLAGDVAYYRGIAAFIIMMAQISIILFVMNMLPIPVVDGSHLLFFLIETVRGKPLNEKFMERFQAAGVVFLISLFVLIMINDITTIF